MQKLGENDDKIDPDTFENLEFGIRYDLPIGLSFSAAYFEIEANKPEYDAGTMTSSMVKSDTTGLNYSLLAPSQNNGF